jgi:ABC-type amino acid transport system permease subunit
MVVGSEIAQATLATVVLWSVSGSIAIVFGLLLTAGSLSTRPFLHFAARSSVNITRGIPTSLFVIAAGIGMMRLPRIPGTPHIFPGTLAPFQHIAWGIALALAVGSAGHFAEIFRAARMALGQARLEQAKVLGLSRLESTRLLAREAAAIALPPTGSRLVHHLHNTAFAALFPVMDVFGHIQGEANATFRVLEFAALGCAIYVVLSALTWLLVRGLEATLMPPSSRVRRQSVVTVWS